MSRGRIRARKAAISLLYGILSAAGILVNGLHGRLIWLLLILHCYTDCRNGTVYCLPTHMCIGVEAVVYAAGIICGVENTNNLPAIAVCICGIIFGSRVIGAYASGDEEIYVMLVLSAVNRGMDIIFYGIFILGCSGAVFVMWRLCLLAGIILSGNRKRKKFAMEAPMLPAILAAYFIAEQMWLI